MSILPIFQQDRELARYCTFGIGGRARFLVEVKSCEEMTSVLFHCHQKGLRFRVVGHGSNILFSDEGFDGVIIVNRIRFCEWYDDSVHVGAGHSFALLGRHSIDRGLGGLEFATGIPGSVGGAVFMNAGACGQSTSDIVDRVFSLSLDTGEQSILSRDEMEFGYRSSPFQQKSGGIILSVIFTLRQDSLAKERERRCREYRQKSQPYNERSAGSVFRNPTNEHYAAALIDSCGLKGVKVGKAIVSLKHANFIVNQGGARAEDVKQLILLIQQQVQRQHHISLIPEIQIIES